MVENTEAGMMIYIPLLNEGVDVWRPSEVLNFGEGYYLILPNPEYDPDNETWEFPPETMVTGEWRGKGADENLYATGRLVLSPDEMEWLSFADEEEHDLWEIRGHLKEAYTQDAFEGLIRKKLIQIKEDETVLDEEAAIETIRSVQESHIPKREIVITSTGSLVYMNHPDIRKYFEIKRK